MNNLVADSETSLRLLAFLLVFATLALAELYLPRRQLSVARSRRWFANIGLSLFNTALVRVLIPLAGVAGAIWAEEQHWGLFNVWQLPAWLSVLLFLLLFDLTIYLQHRLFHWQPILWRMHRMHHTDPDYDLTTGNRFHPGSILLSALIKFALVLALGPSPLAVVLAEVLLNVTSMFNHSNIRLPSAVDRALRLVLVTPDMHRVHHSVEEREYSNNFGFNFPWWDRLFGTYLAQPHAGHEKMAIGIRGFPPAASTSIAQLLVQPLKNPHQK